MVGGDAQSPLAPSVTEPAAEIGAAQFEFLRGHHARSILGERQVHIALGCRRAPIIHRADDHFRNVVGEVADAQSARLVGVVAIIEEGHFKLVACGGIKRRSPATTLRACSSPCCPG